MAIKKKEFSLDAIKNKYSTKTKYKETEFYEVGESFHSSCGLPGPALGNINMFLGHSNSSKTTALVKAAVSAQKKGHLPVFIITEKKWSWDHAVELGLVAEMTDGEWDGQFIFNDNFDYIEQVTDYINELLDEQEKGNIPYSLCFLWDSVGSIPCKMSIEKSTNNNEWNAGAMSQQFGNFINQRIVLSRKSSQPYTNTLVAVNKVWVAKPDSPMGQPTLNNKGGNTMYFDSSLVITFGNIARAGTNKIKATKNGKEVEFAIVTGKQIS